MTTRTECRIAAYHFRMLDSRRLGEETALAGLPWQTYQHADQEEHESYMAGWKETVATLALSAGRLAEVEDELDRTEKQPSWRTWAAKWWHTFIQWDGE